MAKRRKNIASEDIFNRTLDFLIRQTIKLTIIEFKLATFIKCVPFELEDDFLFRVKLFKSKWKMLLWHVVYWVYLLQTAFLWISLGWKMWKEPFDEDVVMHLIYIMAASMGYVFMTALYLKPGVCVVLLNAHSLVVRTSQDSDVQIPHWASHYFVILCLNYYAIGGIGMWVVQAIMFLWKPTSSKHIYAYLPLSWQQSYGVFAAALLHELSWTAWYITLLGMSLGYWCACVFTTNDVLASLLSKKKTTEDHVKVYRYLHLFSVIFNDFNGSVCTVGFTTMIVAVPVVLIYLALTATDLHLLMYMMLPVVSFFCVFLIMFFLPQYSKNGILSKELLTVFRSRLIKREHGFGNARRLADYMEEAHRKVILKKRMRALAPVGIRIWHFGIYTLQTSQELMDQLFNNILLLLSL